METPISPIAHLEDFQIRTYEIDHHKVCTVPSLIKLMHEAAMQNVIQLKLSVWDLEVNHISWVLMRKYLKINRLPVLGERIKIYTSPSGFEKFFTYRDYKIYSESNEVIAFSSSTWLLMDTIKRRMTRIPNFILDYNDKMPNSEERLVRPSRVKLPEFEQVDFSKTYKVGWFDLDFNTHLNNVFYTQWMLEALPNEILQTKKLKDLKIEYRVEGQLDQSIHSEIQQIEDNAFLHRLNRDGKELARALTTWE